MYLPIPFTSNRLNIQRGFAFGTIIVVALIAFEIFNYSTTEFALTDLLGDLNFLGIRWATILAIAFCGIDFAGIARLFTPEMSPDDQSSTNPLQIAETWYLFGAWLLAATMNAILTWWGISIAVMSHHSLGAQVLDRSTFLSVVPIFVAILVWLIRVLIIGTFAAAGERLFSQAELPTYKEASFLFRQKNGSVPNSWQSRQSSATPAQSVTSFRPMQAKRPTSTIRTELISPASTQPESLQARPEPIYHPPLPMSAKQSIETHQARR